MATKPHPKLPLVSRDEPADQPAKKPSRAQVLQRLEQVAAVVGPDGPGNATTSLDNVFAQFDDASIGDDPQRLEAARQALNKLLQTDPL